MQRKNKNIQGFTLLELLLVITVLGILMAVAITTYGRARKNISYTNNVNQVLEIIRDARSLSLSSKQVNLGDGDVSPNYYIVEITPNTNLIRYYLDTSDQFREFNDDYEDMLLEQDFTLSDEFVFSFGGVPEFERLLLVYQPPYADLEMFEYNFDETIEPYDQINLNLSINPVEQEVFTGQLKQLFLNRVSGIPAVISVEEPQD